MNGDMLPAFQAVDDYLDDLLSDVPSSLPALAAEWDLSWPPSTSGYLICTAAGVVVAMPMNQVADILPASSGYDDEVQADYGETRRLVRVVDLARILADDLHEPAADMLVVLHGWRWALACRRTEEETSLIVSADIDWRVARPERHRRPWLGGMCKNGSRVVLDVVALLDILDQNN